MPEYIEVINLEAKNNSVTTKKMENNSFQKHLSFLVVRNKLVRELLAEILGTYLLCVFGLASCAQNLFSGNNSFLSVNLSFGFGATLAGIVIGKVSGCHVNPAVSLAVLLTGGMSIIQFVIYVIGQFIGAFVGALTVWLAYYSSISAENEHDKIIGIFASYPSKDVVTTTNAFFDQIIGTSLLVIIVLTITDKRNSHLSHATVCSIVGITIVIIGTAFGYNCGYPINPARDLAPRIVSSIVVRSELPFTKANYFFWVPIVGPLIGAFKGVLVNYLIASLHWQNE